MPTYEYKGFDLDGKPAKGMIDAGDVKSARERLAGTGILARKIAPAGQGERAWHSRESSSIPSDVRAMAYRELSALVRAGLPIARALELLMDSPELADYHSRLAIVREQIREGADMQTAMAVGCGSISGYEKALLAVGDKTGGMDEMLERLADAIEEQRKLAENVQTAMIYPAIVILVAIGVAIGVLGFVMPQLNRMLVDMRVPIPGVTKFVLGLGRGLLTWGVPLVVVLGVSGAALFGRARSDVGMQKKINRFLFRIPVIGSGYAVLTNLRFARALSALLQGGVGAVEALPLAGQASGSLWIEEMIQIAAREVSHGDTVADAIRRVGPLSTSLPGWIEAGEASGDLENLLDRAADRYQRQWDKYLERVLKMIEPTVILILGIFVALVALAIMLPVVSANTLIDF